MDKAMKAEIKETLELLRCDIINCIDDIELAPVEVLPRQREMINTATSSLTALIIKWLEGKKIDILDHHEKYHKDCHRCIEIFACNQLITELIGEVNGE